MITLDLGCGTYCRGDVGIDIQFTSRNPFDQPEKFDFLMGSLNNLCDKVLADLNQPLPIRSNSVNEVIMRAVLEHLLKPYDCLLEVRRVLKVGGKLKLVVPNAKVSQADWRDKNHYFSFTKPTITNLVSKVLKVIKVETYFGGESIYVEAVKDG